MIYEYTQELLSKKTIYLAITGDENALLKIYSHYKNLIKKSCRKKYYDSNGNIHYYYDEDKEQKIKEHIANAIKRYEF